MIFKLLNDYYKKLDLAKSRKETRTIMIVKNVKTSVFTFVALGSKMVSMIKWSVRSFLTKGSSKEFFLGEKIDLLIRSNIRNWQGKEYLNKKYSVEETDKNLRDAFQANKLRNQMITEINHLIHNEPLFHFRNYHNY